MKLKSLKASLRKGRDLPELTEEESAELWAEVSPVWTAALESGRYSQTNDVLHDKKGYCCLGVLADILQPSGWSAKQSRVWRFAKDLRYDHPLDVDGVLGYEVWDALGNPIEQEELANANDEGENFQQIAERIKAVTK